MDKSKKSNNPGHRQGGSQMTWKVPSKIAKDWEKGDVNIACKLEIKLVDPKDSTKPPLTIQNPEALSHYLNFAIR